MKIEIDIEKKHFYVLLGVLLVGFSALFVIAGHGDSNPASYSVGSVYHYLQDVVKNDAKTSVDSDNDGVIDEAENSYNSDKIDNLDSSQLCLSDGSNCPPASGESDPTVLASVKDGISWNEISNRPSGLDDGDDVRSRGKAVYLDVCSVNLPLTTTSRTCYDTACCGWVDEDGHPRCSVWYDCNGNCGGGPKHCTTPLVGYLVN